MRGVAEVGMAVMLDDRDDGCNALLNAAWRGGCRDGRHAVIARVRIRDEALDKPALAGWNRRG